MSTPITTTPTPTPVHPTPSIRPASTGRPTFFEQRRFRRLERRIERIDDDERLAVLKALGRESAVVQMIEPTDQTAGAASCPGRSRSGSAIAGWASAGCRPRFGRPSASASAAGEITLAGAGRYGRYWILAVRRPRAPRWRSWLSGSGCSRTWRQPGDPAGRVLQEIAS